MKQISLYFRQGTSDKEYHVQLEKSGSGYVVNFQYGRRGSTLTTGSKTTSPVSLVQADKIYESLVGSKLAKGYTEGASGKPYEGTPKAPKASGLIPQLLNPIDESELDKYIQDEDWGAQEKKDGKHVLLRVQDGNVTGYNRKGLEIGIPQEIVDSSTRLDNCILDGECIGSNFYAFDIIEHNDKSVTSYPYLKRYDLLVSVCHTMQVVKLHVGKTKKRALFDKLTKDGKEGIVFKRLTASYSPGRPASGGDMLKYKFYSTASCVVDSGRAGKRSVGLMLMDGGELVSVGNVTVPSNQNIPKEGQIVEIRYLYAYENGSLYQPVLLGVRDDLSIDDCEIRQLKYKSESEEE